MAVNFLNNREVSDLCLGKPPLKWVPIGATVAEALSALKKSGESHVSVWSCCSDHHSSSKIKSFDNNNAVIVDSPACKCVGKICMVDVICFLCKEENLADPFKALEASISQILLKAPPLSVRHLEPNSRFTTVFFFSNLVIRVLFFHYNYLWDIFFKICFQKLEV